MAKEVGQVFGGIGDAVNGVIKGVGDAVNGAVKGVGTLAKQIWDSDVGKAIIIAGAIYFGGAALAGGWSSAGAGGSFFSGMGAGVSSAAGSLQAAWAQSSLAPLSSAWTSASTAGTELGASQAAATLSATAAPAAAPAAAPVAAAPPPVAPTAALGAPPPVAAAAPSSISLTTPYAAPGIETAALNTTNLPAATQPWYSQALDYITPKSELAKYGLISGATSVAGHVISGIGQQQAAQEQRDYEAEQLRKAQELRNANVGANLFAPGQYAAAAPGPAPMPAGLARRYMPQTSTSAPGYVPGSQFAQMYNQLPPGYGAVRAVTG